MKPVIRKRNGLWQCRGGGHKGSGGTPRGAYWAWLVNVTRAKATPAPWTWTQRQCEQWKAQNL